MSDRAPHAPPDEGPAEAEGPRQPLTGDAQARVDDLYRLHFAEIVRFVTRTFGEGPPDPEDAAQAAFEHYSGLLQPEAVENARAFLYRSARNFVLDFKRRAKVRARFAQSADSADFGNSRDDLDAERVLSAKERLAILTDAIEGMEPRLREVFVLNRIHELSHAEIARRKRISQTQSKKLVALGLKICERVLKTAERRRP